MMAKPRKRAPQVPRLHDQVLRDPDALAVAHAELFGADRRLRRHRKKIIALQDELRKVVRDSRSFRSSPRLGHRSFAILGSLAPLGAACDPVLVHRPAVSLPASFPRSVALTQLRFASIRMTSSRRDLHPQDSAHAARDKSERARRSEHLRALSSVRRGGLEPPRELPR